LRVKIRNIFSRKRVKKGSANPKPIGNTEGLAGSSPSAPAKAKSLENAEFLSVFKAFSSF
jgi:hypothetical protein